jgi:hypothetical protein
MRSSTGEELGAGEGVRFISAHPDKRLVTTAKAQSSLSFFMSISPKTREAFSLEDRDWEAAPTKRKRHPQKRPYRFWTFQVPWSKGGSLIL